MWASNTLLLTPCGLYFLLRSVHPQALDACQPNVYHPLVSETKRICGLLTIGSKEGVRGMVIGSSTDCALDVES